MKMNICHILTVLMFCPGIANADKLLVSEGKTSTELAEVCCGVAEETCEQFVLLGYKYTEWFEQNYYELLITAPTAREAIDECKGLSVAETHKVNPCVVNDTRVKAEPVMLTDCQ